MHDPELLIRTGGERRLSNYLLWQVVETELVFTEELWPDFSRDSLERAIRLFREPKRRRADDQSSTAQCSSLPGALAERE